MLPKPADADAAAFRDSETSFRKNVMLVFVLVTIVLKYMTWLQNFLITPSKTENFFRNILPFFKYVVMRKENKNGIMKYLVSKTTRVHVFSIKMYKII